MKEYVFLDGSTIVVEDNVCRGCFLETDRQFPPEMDPVFRNEEIVVRQDAECPVPGFFIVSTRKHIHSLADIPLDLSEKIMLVLRAVRRGQRNVLGIERVHIYLEERIIEPHFHVWLLPLYLDIIKKYNVDPKIWNNTVKSYLDLFTFSDNQAKIISANEKISAYLAGDEMLAML